MLRCLGLVRTKPAQNSAMMFVAQSTDPANTAFRGMRLETKDETLIDGAQVAHADARTLWVRQRGAPKALSAVSVGITPGADDPQAAWSLRTENPSPLSLTEICL